MNKKNKTIYHYLIPKFIRRRLEDHKTKQIILNYYAGLPKTAITVEHKEALHFLGKNKLCVFPYPFQFNYKRKDISVSKDEVSGLKYIVLDGKRLFFKRKTSIRGIKRAYNYLRIEQDINSPHCYLTDNFNILENDVLVDVGAAEGNLALSVIEKVKKVYFFETDENWIEALRATFEPWKDKIEIINKLVSNTNNDTNVSLDEFFKDRDICTFLKIDAEGSDAEVLKGGEKLLSSKNPLKVALCCYHRPNDEDKFSQLLLNKGYSVSFSNGFMIYNNPDTFFPPYLRKGVLRAEYTL